jgi:ketosteroid isomerase-like protein
MRDQPTPRRRARREQNEGLEATEGIRMADRERLDENKELTAQFIERMNEGDIDGAFALLTDDATWFTLSTRQHVPKEQMRAAIELTTGSMLQAPVRQHVTITTAEDDRVAVMSEGHAVTIEGTPYDNLYHLLFELRDGRIARIWEFNDTAHVRDVLRRGEGGTLGLAGGQPR